MMHSILITWLSIFIPLGSLFFIGLPVAALLNTKQQELSHQTLWVIAPFLGLAVIVLLLQNLVYLGIPIAKSFYSVWFVAACLWVILIKTDAIKKIVPIPGLLLFAAFIIYLVHGLGMVVVGPEYYVGHGWYDQFNYVSVSQFLMDHSLLHAHLNDLINQPSALRAFLLIASERIGQDVFQGFVASSLSVSAKTSFEPVILMLPFLTVLVIYEIAKRFFLSRNIALLVAVLAGSLPSLALIHLESFLSQALATPLLLLWPCILVDVFEKINWKTISATALLLSAVASIYAEFYFIFLFLAFCFSVVVSYQNKSIKPVVILFIIALVALCLNSGFSFHLMEQAVHAIHNRSYVRIYPWVESLDALHWLWLGEFTLTFKYGWKIVVDSFSIIFFTLAYIGFGIAAYKKRDALSISFFMAILLPIVIWLVSVNQYGYQFYKLLITMSPLFPVGIALACKFLFASRLYCREISAYLSVLLGTLTLSATLFMVLLSTNIDALTYLKRGVGYKLLQTDTREIQDTLSEVSGQDILIVWQDDFRHGDFINGWLTYFARNNRVWLTNSLVGDKNLQPYLADMKSLPKHYLLLTSPTFHVTQGTTKLWENGTYVLWRI